MTGECPGAKMSNWISQKISVPRNNKKRPKISTLIMEKVLNSRFFKIS